MNESVTTRWLDPLFKTESMCRVFSDCGRLQRMLDFEAALARALAANGLISRAAAAAITERCKVEFFDMTALAQATAQSGNTAIPAITELERLVGGDRPEAARYVHFGATSQDAMDTGLILQIREALALIEDDIQRLSTDLSRLATKHKEVPTVGRTWLQQAAPTTFGLKVAGWLDALARHRERIAALRPRCLVLQLGGPVGTLAAYREQAQQVAARVAAELGLELPELPWHTHRDRICEVAVVLALTVGTLGKMARDIALLSQPEIAEVAEPAASGRGGSSSMPQKRNPVSCAVVLAAAARVPALVSVMLGAMPQEHERGLGGWQAEWETLPEIFELTAGTLEHLARVVSGLAVDAARMQTNLEATRGLVYAEAVSAALALRIGRQAAHQLTERACRRVVQEGQNLAVVVAEDAEIASHLSAVEQKRLFDSESHVRAAARLVDQVVNTVSRSAPSQKD